MEKKTIIYTVLLVTALAVVVGLLWQLDQQAAPKRNAYADLARCLSEKDVKFYGAFWCPACAQQKALFEGSAKQLPYVECSLPNRQQNDLCTEAEITNYPVWEFNGNYRCSSVTGVEVLAHLADCALPTYDGIKQTPNALYERLVAAQAVDSLKKRGIPADKIDEFIQATVESINTHLTEQHGTTIETVASADHMLTAIAETLYNCAPYEKQEPEEEMIEGEAAEGETPSEEEPPTEEGTDGGA